MDSIAGQTISHFLVLSRLGDRGTVYRAEDTGSGRLVQLKFHPKEVLENQKAFSQFQHVARTIAALDHPHIAAVFDLGEWEGRPFVVTELPDGESLAQYIAQKTPRFSDVLDLCEQVAGALDAAHSAGVVHGGLQPANILLTRRNEVRVADFGLAALVASARGEDRSTPEAAACLPPEQVRGEECDGRSDLYSLGAILYEMATGQPPFTGEDPAAIRRAILELEPPPPSRANPDLPVRFDEIVGKAMEKDRDMRYQVAAELRTDLRRLRRDWETERVAAARAALAETGADGGAKQAGNPALGKGAVESPRSKRSTALTIAAALFLAAAVGAVAVRLLRRSPQPLPMVLHSLTSGRGVIASARFAPDTRTIFYTAQWDAEPPRIFSTSAGASSVPLAMNEAELLSVSPSKELAVLAGVNVSASGRVEGNLQNVVLAGGGAQPLLANVEAADWSPAGRSIAVVRRVGGKDRLEYPIGKVLAETEGWIGDPRFSPAGDRIAFVEHPRQGDDAGSVAMVTLDGVEKNLSENWANVRGLAWAPRGKEIWFTASRRAIRQLYAVDLTGKTRQVMTTPGSLHLYDIAADGRVLLSRDDVRTEIGEFTRGEKAGTDLASLTGSELRDVSPDGKTLLLEQETAGDAGGNAIFVRRMGASAAQREGTGRALALSPDGKQVLAEITGPHSHLVVLPVGEGQPVNLPVVEVSHLWAAWLPDGKQFVFLGSEAGRRLRLFVEDVAGGAPRSISPAGVGSSAALAPNGRYVAAMGPDGKGYLYPVNGGEVPAFRGLSPGDTIVAWSRYSSALYVAEGAVPVKIFRLSLVSGAKTLLWQIAPGDPAGVARLRTIRVTPDGRFCFFSYRRTLSHLYLAEGLR